MSGLPDAGDPAPGEPDADEPTLSLRPPGSPDNLPLDLRLRPPTPPPPSTPEDVVQFQPGHEIHLPNDHPRPPQLAAAPTGRPTRTRKPNRPKNRSKTSTIPPPYPWATDRRCHIHPLTHLQQHGITHVTGNLQCRNCGGIFKISLNVEASFAKILNYIVGHAAAMRNRAPERWKNPAAAECPLCHQRNAAKPVMEGKKRAINWVFLFLGEMVGFCRLAELKYYCKHRDCHRTGAKDRLLYMAFLDICRQLSPACDFLGPTSLPSNGG